MKVLVAGWFSFEQMGATAGDLMARDLVCDWIVELGVAYDVALAAPFEGGVEWQQVQPEAYSHVIFVCGPFGNGWPITEFLPRFSGARLIGIDLSMLESLERWNPFDVLFERDSSEAANPDITFLAPSRPVPVVGMVLVHPQKEYGKQAMHERANQALWHLVESHEAATVQIDTRLDENQTGLRSPAEVESLIARMDLVLTTRLHGTVLALKNGIPALAIDPIAGGAKIRRQAETIGWPVVFTADALQEEALHKAFEYCLTEEARGVARSCGERARQGVQEIQHAFSEALLADVVK